jgi:hypothetical protein
LFSRRHNVEPDSPAFLESRERFHSARAAATGANAAAPAVIATATVVAPSDQGLEREAEADASVAANVEPSSAELPAHETVEVRVGEGTYGVESENEPVIHGRSIVAHASQRIDVAATEFIQPVEAILIEKDPQDESPPHSDSPSLPPGPDQELPAHEYASVATGVPEPEEVRPTAESEPLHVTVPDVELVMIDASRPAIQEQAHTPAQTTITSHPSHAPAPVERDVLIQKGEERLERGDIAGARLLFSRAAESGDPRAAIGMARTFDAEILRTLRVYGIRPDPAQAAHWYARSKTLHAVASTR